LRRKLTVETSNSRYKQLKISIDPTIASRFKMSCATANTSMAAVLSQFIVEYTNTTVSRKASPDYTTRKRRRKAIQAIVKQLEQIRVCEEDYRDRIPENLQGSMVYDRADELVSVLNEVIDLLDPVCMVL